MSTADEQCAFSGAGVVQCRRETPRGRNMASTGRARRPVNEDKAVVQTWPSGGAENVMFIRWLNPGIC
jgi:hypothetical protein